MAEKIHVITSVERRRRFSDEEKRQIVDEAAVPGAGVSAVARRHGIAVNLLFSWRKALKRGLSRIQVPGLSDELAQRVEGLRLAVAAVRQERPGKVARFPVELRSEALALIAQGVSAAELVMATGLSPTTVSHWQQDAADGQPLRELKMVGDGRTSPLRCGHELAIVRIGAGVSVELPISALKDDELWHCLVKIGGQAS